MKLLNLKKPLASIDLETTGLYPDMDRIIEIGVVKLYLTGRKTRFHQLVNPGIKIPPEATAVHHIDDKAVKSAPSFSKIARRLDSFLQDCTLLGFNLLFDLAFLTKEFQRVRRPFSTKGRSLIDCKTIYHKMEPRDLAAAVSFYCGEEHLNAHSALSDARASLSVLEGQLKRYQGLPKSVTGLHRFCAAHSGRFFDNTGKFERRYGQPVFTFGKYRGQMLKTVAADDPDYLAWLLQQGLPDDTSGIIERELKRSRRR